MTFYEACAWLARAVDEDPATFGPLRRFTPVELIDLEHQLGYRLPVALQALLQAVGAGTVFRDEHGAIDILDPTDVYARFEDSFDDPGRWIGPRVMPVAVDQRLQEVAAFHFLVDSPHNFVVMSHEYYLDEVHEDPVDDRPGWWTTLEEWLVTMVECRGRFDPH